MPWIMIDYPEAAWSKQQLIDHLKQTTNLLRSKVFKPSALFTRQSQTRWVELIHAISDLVRQAALAGKRIDFTEEVNSHDERQDITSLLDSMRQSAYVAKSSIPVQSNLTIIAPALNSCYGVGTGYFANGLFFTCQYENEWTFFIGRERIYFYRHLIRAFVEARVYSLSLP